MVVTKHPPTPGEGGLAELARLVVGADVAENTNEDTGGL
jgi:hypothetical protein